MHTKPTVFVVDRDSAVRRATAAAIEAKGVPVKTFGSAETFLAELHPLQCGCLVAEVRLPGMDGLELQERLRAVEVAMPVIMVGPRGKVATAVRAMRNGALVFLEKPYSDHELWKHVAKALGRYRQNVPAGTRPDFGARVERFQPRQLHLSWNWEHR